VKIADEGTCRQLVWSEDKIEVVLNGQQCTGTYVFIRFKRAGTGQWIIMKKGHE
jgi:hypothetical protein